MTSAEAGWKRGLLRPSYLRFAPRVGVAWAVGQDAKTVVNAGFGVFLNQWAYSVQQALASTLPFFFAKTVTAASDALQPTQEISTVLLAPANGTVGGNTMDWDFRTEYAKNYSVSVQRQVTPSTMFEVSFLRSAIVGADSSTVRNVPEPGPGPVGPRRPIPQLANITAIRWDGYSIFNGVTFRAEQRLSRGLASTVSYSFSKAIDDASDPGGTSFESNLPQDVRNMAAEEARASFDHTAPFRRQRHLCLAESRRRRVRGGARIQLAGERHRPARIGRALYREPGHRPREYRSRAGAASQHDVRPE